MAHTHTRRSASGTLSSSSGTIGDVSAMYLNPNGFSLENFKVKTDGRVLAEASLKFTESLKFNASIGTNEYFNICSELHHSFALY